MSNLEELRALLLGPAHSYIDELESKNATLELRVGDLQAKIFELDSILSDPENHAKLMSESMAEAMITRYRMDTNGEKAAKMKDAVAPIVEESLLVSVEENPDKIANAIYPIMLPSITKAVKQLLQSTIQEINRTLDQQFSPKAIGWRIKAMRTGKSYGEVLLSETLSFRVEQAFLVHKETGLLLLHSSIEKKHESDADVISAMLTAIQDFVKDSFTSEKSETLDTLNVGDLTVWVERSPYAYLAVVIRGQPPGGLRENIQEVLLKIHSKHRHDLKDYSGDDYELKRSQSTLDRVLVAELKSKGESSGSSKKKTIWKRVLFTFGILALSFFIYRSYVMVQWDRYVEELSQIPGVIILNDEYMHVEGLLGEDTLLETSQLNRRGFTQQEIEFEWTRINISSEAHDQQ